MKTALITGVNGQDGSYLAEYLLELGYEVHGLIRRASTFNCSRIEHLFDKITLHLGDISDPLCVSNLVRSVQPDELYNLAAQSHVAVSFEVPAYTLSCTGGGALNVFESVRCFSPHTKVYQASTSELFGGTWEYPVQSESTPFCPRSPYALAKQYAHGMAEHYRTAYSLWIACGILFNHESERRGETFVTRKITRGLARIKCGLDKKLVLGNTQAWRDWGYAPEYVRGMHLMLQAPKPLTLVMGTGKTHTVNEFLLLAMELVGGVSGESVVTNQSRYTRPEEVDHLQANPYLALKELGWKTSTTFPQLVELMIKHDLDLAKVGH